MFTPIYSGFTEDTYTLTRVFIGTGAALLYILWSLVINSIRWVKDERTRAPFDDCCDDNTLYTAAWTGLWSMMLFAGAFFAALILIPVINWGWFVCSIIAVIIGIMFIARAVLRLKKQLNYHVNDKTVHK